MGVIKKNKSLDTRSKNDDNWNSKHLMGLRINLKTKAFSFAVMYSSFTALLLFSVNQKFSLPFFLAHPSDIVK